MDTNTSGIEIEFRLSSVDAEELIYRTFGLEVGRFELDVVTVESDRTVLAGSMVEMERFMRLGWAEWARERGFGPARMVGQE